MSHFRGLWSVCPGGPGRPLPRTRGAGGASPGDSLCGSWLTAWPPGGSAARRVSRPGPRPECTALLCNERTGFTFGAGPGSGARSIPEGSAGACLLGAGDGASSSGRAGGAGTHHPALRRATPGAYCVPALGQAGDQTLVHAVWSWESSQGFRAARQGRDQCRGSEQCQWGAQGAGGGGAGPQPGVVSPCRSLCSREYRARTQQRLPEGPLRVSSVEIKDFFF